LLVVHRCFWRVGVLIGACFVCSPRPRYRSNRNRDVAPGLLTSSGPWRTCFLYTLTNSNRSDSEPAGAKTRNRKGVFAEWKSDAGGIIQIDDAPKDCFSATPGQERDRAGASLLNARDLLTGLRAGTRLLRTVENKSSRKAGEYGRSSERRYASTVSTAGSGRVKRPRKRSTADSSPSILMSPERNAFARGRP
jgi:hypothetical protein